MIPIVETMFLARVRGVLKAHSQRLNENLVLSPWHTWKSRLPLEFTRNLPLPFPTPIFFHGYFLMWTGQRLKWEVWPHKQMQINNLDKWPPTQAQEQLVHMSSSSSAHPRGPHPSSPGVGRGAPLLCAPVFPMTTQALTRCQGQLPKDKDCGTIIFLQCSARGQAHGI